LKIIVTGGAGFIGSAVIRRALTMQPNLEIVNVDKLTYAGNLESLEHVVTKAQIAPRYRFHKADICDPQAMTEIISAHKPDAIMHLAAESHVDRSIDGPKAFIDTNILGTYTLLQATRTYWAGLDVTAKSKFRFHHVSTDEVYGSLGREGFFTEQSRYEPNSPYSASKAASDHLVRAWQHTFGLPTVTTNCSNNYGPYQFPEKLIPLMILNCLESKPLPVYGKGDNIRDWLFVDDHAEALLTVIQRGKIGETYNIGGHNEMMNLDVVHTICDIVDELRPELRAKAPRRSLVKFVTDRPGHDQRYAIDASFIAKTLGWKPRETFSSGIRKTVQWYLDNQVWCQHVQDGSYRRERLGNI